MLSTDEKVGEVYKKKIIYNVAIIEELNKKIS